MLQSPVWIFSENQLFSPIPFAKKEQFAQCCLPWAGSSSQKSGPGLFPAEIQATPSQSSWPKLSFLAPLTSLQWHCKFPNETDFFPPSIPTLFPKQELLAVHLPAQQKFQAANGDRGEL